MSLKTIIVRATSGPDRAFAEVRLAGVSALEAQDSSLTEKREQAMEHLFIDAFGVAPTEVGTAVLPYHRETDGGGADD